MRGIWIFCLAVCVDLISFTALTYGGTLLKTHRESFHGFANFLREWTEAVLRSTVIFAVSALTKDADRSVFKRWVITHCFLGPLFGTGRMVFLESYPLDKFKTWFVSAGAAAAACFFWEMTFADYENSNGEEKKQKSRQLLMRVIRLYRPDILLLIGAFTFLTLAVICETFIPFYTGRVIDILGSQYKWNEFQSAIFFTGIFSLGSSISAGCRGGLFMCAISSFICRVKVKLFGSLVKQDISFFERIKTGDITSRLSTDTNLMAQSVALNVNILLRTFIKTLGMLSLMLGLSWKLTLLMLMETPVTGLLQGIYDSHYQRLSKEVQDSMARANETAGEAVSGIRTVRSFSKEQSEARRYDQRLMDTHKLKTHRDTVRAVYLLVRRLAEVGMKVAMLYYGRLFIQSGQMSTGNLVSFILYQSDLGDNIRTLIYIFGDMLNSVGAAGKVFEYLDRKPHVSMDGTIQPDTLKGHVIFQDVTFSYPTRPDHTVLEHFSLELKPGEMTALVGQSGGGKSTCVSLLERFYHPQHGQILLDGQPLQNYQHSYLHSKVAMVGQEPVLFSGTIRDNIAYGLRDCPLKQVQDVARKVNAHGFISQLEKGYDTDVGEQGGLLSGGEKQRIAIARALIREPRVLILDEVTSCLDSESENMVQQTLAGCPNQTLLVIAHRLKTIEKANQIVFINNGEVLEQGTHDELMSKQGTYYKWRNMVFTNDSATTQ